MDEIRCQRLMNFQMDDVARCIVRLDVLDRETIQTERLCVCMDVDILLTRCKSKDYKEPDQEARSQREITK